jgi:hypothetical protein
LRIAALVSGKGGEDVEVGLVWLSTAAKAPDIGGKKLSTSASSLS